MSRSPGRPRAGAAPIAPTADLLSLALEAFGDLGYEGTSVRDLCRRLGVSQNLIHQRFGSKDQLWFAAVDHGFGTLTLELAKAAAGAADDDLDRLRAVLVRFIEVSAASPALLRVMNHEAGRATERLDYIFSTYVGPAMELVTEMWKRLEGEGRARPVPPAVFHFLVAYGAAGPLSMRPLASKFGRSGLPRGNDVGGYANGVVDLLLHGMVV
ncbi:MAG: TetR/AcrR family transcriptional regulator [Actinobacteria bacterium]|nr:TetR/AcrR family transcriptional regulator [Actinomycetota bacterium]